MHGLYMCPNHDLYASDQADRDLSDACIDCIEGDIKGGSLRSAEMRARFFVAYVFLSAMVWMVVFTYP